MKILRNKGKVVLPCYAKTKARYAKIRDSDYLTPAWRVHLGKKFEIVHTSKNCEGKMLYYLDMQSISLGRVWWDSEDLEII